MQKERGSLFAKLGLLAISINPILGFSNFAALLPRHHIGRTTRRFQLSSTGGNNNIPSASNSMSTAPIPVGNDVTTTPLHPDTSYNFGPASPKDQVLYTSERPGRDPPGKDATISAATVREWIAYMRAEPRQISRVLVLVDDNELEIYESPGLFALYEEGGLAYHHTPMGEAGASERVVGVIRAAEANGERVVAHCTHGMGRSGRVAAGWVAERYGLSAEEATEVVMAEAKVRRVERLGSPTLLKKWLAR